ncbi:MAG: HI0074 family nucleotidyltransferase substrate-binding subunit [Acidobacteriota bacterium]
MERLKLKYNDAKRALGTLEEIIKEPFSVIIRDATIQRFEYTFEALWKFLREYLKEKEGIISNSPKGCFREIFSLGFLTEDETVRCLEMTDRRNDTSHTYKEEVAQMIYSRVKDYCGLMVSLLNKFKGKI